MRDSECVSVSVSATHRHCTLKVFDLNNHALPLDYSWELFILLQFRFQFVFRRQNLKSEIGFQRTSILHLLRFVRQILSTQFRLFRLSLKMKHYIIPAFTYLIYTAINILITQATTPLLSVILVVVCLLVSF